jgi:hypothetical protein
VIKQQCQDEYDWIDYDYPIREWDIRDFLQSYILKKEMYFVINAIVD